MDCAAFTMGLLSQGGQVRHLAGYGLSLTEGFRTVNFSGISETPLTHVNLFRAKLDHDGGEESISGTSVRNQGGASSVMWLNMPAVLLAGIP